MLGDNIFRLGNIMDESYDDMLNNENLIFLLSAGCSDLWNYRSVYQSLARPRSCGELCGGEKCYPKGGFAPAASIETSVQDSFFLSVG